MPAARRSACIAARTPARRGASCPIRDAGSCGDAVRLPGDADGQHPSKPGTIFAALEVNGVMRTTDGGESWSDCSSDLIRLAQQPHLKSKIVSDTYNEGMLDGHAIAISPADPDKVILAVRMGLFETGGRRQDLAGYGARAVLADYVWPRHQGVTAGRNTLYTALSVAAASKDGGVYRSTDKGATWKRFDKVQVHGTIMSVALHQTDPDQVYIGAVMTGRSMAPRMAGDLGFVVRFSLGLRIMLFGCGCVYHYKGPTLA